VARRERHVVCPRDELVAEGRRIVRINGREIGVFAVGDRLFAVRNVCPHHYAPICRGTVTGTMLPSDVGEFAYGREGLVLRCPWHGFEFDLETGACLAHASRWRLGLFDAAYEGDEVVVYA
jgi:3-phenylpropionate/trans-cinnamate dioxygenase ferredoxin subunit